MTKGVRITKHREDSQNTLSVSVAEKELLCACNRDGNPLQYYYLENPMDGRMWYATVHEVAKSGRWPIDYTCFLFLENKPDPHWIYSSALNFVLDCLCLVSWLYTFVKECCLWLKINIIALSQGSATQAWPLKG